MGRIRIGQSGDLPGAAQGRYDSGRVLACEPEAVVKHSEHRVEVVMDKAGLKLKIPPVAQGIIALILIWLSSRFWPLYRIEINFKNGVSLGIILIGIVVGGLGVSAFIRLRTTVDPRRPDKASRLVVIGIYKYSRNPMYLAILLLLIGVAIPGRTFFSIGHFLIYQLHQSLPNCAGRTITPGKIRRWLQAIC